MYLEPVRRSRHAINHMDTLTHGVVNDILLSMNAQIIVYQEAMKTESSGCPPLCEHVHDIHEELNREKSCLTREKKPMRDSSNPLFFDWCQSNDALLTLLWFTTFQNENAKGVPLSAVENGI